ncbi:MAG: hypothetical protein HY068_07020 [Burkholderiales bacterium]|nr:hypothetical protein [Burkholderiales bacterium]
MASKAPATPNNSNQGTGGVVCETRSASPATDQAASSTSSSSPEKIEAIPFIPTAETEKLYADYMAEIHKRELSGIEHFDKAILTLSSAGLGVSVALLKDVIPLDHATFLPILYASWGMFIVSIVSTLASFLVSGKALDHQKQLAERAYRQGDEAAFSEPNRLDRWTRKLNYTSAISFVVALLLTPAFVIINLEKTPMATTNTPAPGSQSQKGATVPPMQRPASQPAPAPAPNNTPAKSK